ncbi:MAG: hypothetical protein M3406_06945 [Chloroflexota bacterium]|nr:hypothetical protein [Chloroflexota bacterium]
MARRRMALAVLCAGLMAGRGPAAFEDVGIAIENLELEPRRIELAELADGGRAKALMVSLDPAGIDAQGFLIYLPKGAEERWLVAMGADGVELSRLEFQPAP